MGLKEPGLRGSLRNVSVGIDAIPDSEVWDDWADSPTVNSLIHERQTFAELAYQGDDDDQQAPSSGDRPVWEITQGNASVNDTQELLSLERNCLVEYSEIDFSELDISNDELVIRFEYEYYDGHNDSSDAGFSLTVNNPGGGSDGNFAGFPEDGWNMTFGGGPSYNFEELIDGESTRLVDGSWDADTNPHISELRVNDAGEDGLHFEYFYDGTSQGTATSDTFGLSEITILHWGMDDDADADSNPAGINWLEVFAR